MENAPALDPPSIAETSLAFGSPRPMALSPRAAASRLKAAQVDSRIESVGTDGVLDAERADGQALQRAKVGPRAACPGEIAGERADIGPARAAQLDECLAALIGKKLEGENLHFPFLELRLAAFEGDLVGPPAADMDRGVGRRPLQNYAPERWQGVEEAAREGGGASATTDPRDRGYRSPSRRRRCPGSAFRRTSRRGRAANRDRRGRRAGRARSGRGCPRARPCPSRGRA